jgi:hypothetical protein
MVSHFSGIENSSFIIMLCPSTRKKEHQPKALSEGPRASSILDVPNYYQSKTSWMQICYFDALVVAVAFLPLHDWCHCTT